MSKKNDDFPTIKTEYPVSGGKSASSDAPVNGVRSADPTNRQRQAYPQNDGAQRSQSPVSSQYSYIMDSVPYKRRRKLSRKGILAISLTVAALVVIAVVITLILVLQPNSRGENQSYKLILNYGGLRDNLQQVDVQQNNSIPSLPGGFVSNNENYLDFVGWFTEQDCKGIKVCDASGKPLRTYVDDELASLADENRRIYLYVGFIKKEYKVTFYNQDGTKVICAENMPYGMLVQDINITTLDGRPVTGWSNEPNGAEYNGAITEETSLYARTVGVYLTYDTADSYAAKPIIVAEGDKVSLPVPTRENHEFLGWLYNGRLLEDSFVIPDNNVTLVAQWRRTHYKVTFDSGYGQLETKKVAVGDSVVSTFSTRTGYKFSYWEDLYGKRYPKQFEPSDDVYLTAVWTANTYTVTLNACGGKVNTTFQTVTYDSTLKLPVPTMASESDSYTYKYSKGGAKSNTINFTRKYAFLGWFTSQTGGTRITDCWGYGTRWDKTNDLLLYAQWAPLNVKYSKVSTVTVNTSKYPLYATINLAELLNTSVSYLRSMGYTKITLDIFPTLYEVDDGWQEMYISRANSYSEQYIVWKNKAIEHGSGSKDTTTWTHYFTVTVDLTSVSDTLYVILDAHGNYSDTWKMTQLDIFFTVS